MSDTDTIQDDPTKVEDQVQADPPPAPPERLDREEIRKRIRQASDMHVELVDMTDDWGVTLEIHSLTGNERGKWLDRAFDENGDADYAAMYPELIVLSAYVPGTSELVFDDKDVKWLGERSSSCLERVARVALDLSGLNKKAKDEAKKGSSSTPSDGSTTS